jgi:hypothetical protein
LAERNGDRYIRTVRPTAQSNDEFADILGALVNARPDDANSYPGKHQPG